MTKMHGTLRSLYGMLLWTNGIRKVTYINSGMSNNILIYYLSHLSKVQDSLETLGVVDY
jgi:hypothetical protein